MQAIYADALIISLMIFNAGNTIDDLKNIISLQSLHFSNKEVSGLMSRRRPVQLIDDLAAAETISLLI